MTSSTILANNPSKVGASAMTELVNAGSISTSTTPVIITDGTTDMSTSITPSSVDSKVLIMINISHMTSGAHGFFLQRNGIDLIVGNSDSSAVNTTFCNASIGNRIYSYLDSPESTSTQTYSVNIARNTSTGTSYINRTTTDTDSDSFFRYTSRIIAWEIRP